MKQILILSDTHGCLDNSILDHVKDADEIWHAGDVGSADIIDRLQKIAPVKGVWGNIDDQLVRKILPGDSFFECEGVKILITHIAGRPGKYPERVLSLIRKHEPHIFICGHSHILLVQHYKPLNLLHINPGAAGVHGFHQRRTMVRIKIDNGKIVSADAIDMGSRTTKSKVSI